MKIEIIKVKKRENKNSFQVEVELPNRERKKFGFPSGEGWEQEIDGKPKFVRKIEENLKKQKEDNSADIEKLNKKYQYKKIDIE